MDGKYYYLLGQGYDPAKMKIDDNLKEHQFKMLIDRLEQRKKWDFLNKGNQLLKRKSRSLLKNSLNEEYKSKVESSKVWKPSDILSLNTKNAKRSKRSVDHDVDSIENEIGSFVKEIMKETKVDSEHGDYQLVFPNKDKIKVAENRGDTELKLVLHGESTCPVETTTRSNIQKISKKQSDNMWQKLFGKLTKFFQGLSAKLKRCIIQDLLNGA